MLHSTIAGGAAQGAFTPPKLRQIVTEAVFRRKRIFATAVLTFVALATAVTLLMHRKYQSSAKLVVQNVRSAAQLSTNNVDHLVSQGDVSPTEINTEIDLLQSDDVGRRALGMKVANGLGTEAEDRAVRNLEQRLSVDPVHQSNVIDLKLIANSPTQANADLQHIIDSYFEERAGSARNSGAAEFFATQLASKGRQLDEDQAALTSFQVQHGIADLDEQTKLQIQRIAGLQDQLAQAETTLAAQRSRTAAEQRELEATSPRTETQQRTITNQYSQERLSTALVDLENRRTELLKRYQPSDRQVTEIEDKIATTRAALREASQHPAAESATDINLVWQQLSLAVATSGGEISGLLGQRAALQGQVALARQRLNELEQAATAFGELRRRVQQSQADYTLYAQRRDEARISEALDREKLFNVAVLEKPIASPEPVRPKPALYLGSALVLSLFVGIVLAMYADLSGGQVHNPAQLEAITGARTLATFADENHAPHLAEANRLQYRRVLFAIRQNATVLRPRTVEAAAFPTIAGPGGAEAWTSELNAEEVLGGHSKGSCVAFTSALRAEGVSFLASHLATEAALQASTRVAVLSMPTLLHRFEAYGTISLDTQLDDAAAHWVLADGSGRDEAAPAHRRTAQGHFSSCLRPLLEEARSDFDLVVLDCPSLQSSTLALELGTCVDGYVAVVGANSARRQNIQDLISQLGASSSPTLGYLLNRRHYPVPEWLYRILW